MLLWISDRSARSTALPAAACSSGPGGAKIASRIASAASMSSRERAHGALSPASPTREARVRTATSFLVSPVTRSRHGSAPLGLLDSHAHSTSCRSLALPLSTRPKNVARQPMEVMGGATKGGEGGVGPLGASPASATPARMYSVYVVA